MRMKAFLSFLVIGTSMGAGCTSAPAPESVCYGDSDCGPETPDCEFAADSSLNRCTRACTTSSDCGDLEMQTVCDLGMCAAPCTGDAVGLYACVSGERVYCDDDPTLTCDICPGACGAGSYCAGTTCEPRRAAGEACSSDVECSSSSCTAAGQCSAAQGEPCTPESCDGVCAERPSGETMCIRSRCPSDCQDSTAGGLEWYCARYETYEACVPLVSCIWESPCGTFVDATCGQSCRSGGGCWTYCVPNVISTDDD